MYQLINDQITDSVTYIKRLTDNASIPLDAANRDYQEYLKWVAEGNEPLNPDEIQNGETQ